MGVSVQEVTPEMPKAWVRRKGALISEVMKASPAEKAGMKQGDVIIGIDGEPVQNTSSMRFQVSEVMPGNTMKVKVLRDGKEKVFTVVAGDLAKAKIPEHMIAIRITSFCPAPRLQTSPRRQGRHWVSSPKSQGVAVIEVANNSAAAKTGLRPGDIILSLNNKSTTPILRNSRRWLDDLKGIKMSISIYRQGMVMTMTIIR